MSAEIIWQAPPPKAKGAGRKPGRMAAFVAELEKRPGAWAIYPYSTNPGTGAQLKSRYSLDVTYRSRPDGTCDIYARWIGEAS